jgi:fumarate reductase flavoprotein subunit
MASSIGADTTHMAFSGTYAAGVPMSDKPGERHALLLLRMDIAGGIYVNKNGDRFVNETIGHVPVGRIELTQPERRMVIIMDQTMFDGWVGWNKMVNIVTGWSDERVREEAEKGVYIKKANTIKEVAEKVGLPADKLEETINKYNGYVDNKNDSDFGRKDLKYKVEKPPFYAMSVKPIIMQVLGGLRIDPKTHVLDAYDKPIPGLYAAGEAVGGIMGTMYDGGSCIGSGLTFGRIAGKTAAAV